MSPIENVFIGLGAITGASTFAAGLVALACRTEPFIIFLCFIVVMLCIATAALCFHSGGMF
jgi:hypothetical protein